MEQSSTANTCSFCQHPAIQAVRGQRFCREHWSKYSNDEAWRQEINERTAKQHTAAGSASQPTSAATSAATSTRSNPGNSAGPNATLGDHNQANQAGGANPKPDQQSPSVNQRPNPQSNASPSSTSTRANTGTGSDSGSRTNTGTGKAQEAKRSVLSTKDVDEEHERLVETILLASKTVADIHAASKPVEPLQRLWVIGEEELEPVAENAATCVEMLPFDISERISQFSAPLALLISVYAVVAPRMMQERGWRRSYAEAVRQGAVFASQGADMGSGNGANQGGASSHAGSSAYHYPGFAESPI